MQSLHRPPRVTAAHAQQLLAVRLIRRQPCQPSTSQPGQHTALPGGQCRTSLASAAALSGRGAAGAGPRPQRAPAIAWRRCIAPAAASAAGSPAAASPSAPLDLSALDDLALQQQADDWGYTQLGRPIPAGVSLPALADTLPDEAFRIDLRAALGRLALSLALMAAAYWWLWYQHSICPLWQQLLCWVAAGTGYFGAFMTAVDAAHFAFWPDEPGLQEAVGAALMAPALWSFESFRMQYFNHLLFLNMLGEDTEAWHPLQPADIAAMPAWRRVLTRVVVATPLKLLCSMAAWARSWDKFDLKQHPESQRPFILRSWCVPAAFVGLAWPAMLAGGGLAGWASWWLAPWLVFHAWLSLLTLVQHTAPHIPWRRQGAEYDPAQAVINGTVTLALPRWLELLLHDANYHLPAHLASGVPSYRARRAHAALRQKLGPYLTEGRLNARLVLKLLGSWLVWDGAGRRYVDWEEGEALAEQQRAAGAAAAAAAAGGQQQPGQQPQAGGFAGGGAAAGGSSEPGGGPFSRSSSGSAGAGAWPTSGNGGAQGADEAAAIVAWQRAKQAEQG